MRSTKAKKPFVGKTVIKVESWFVRKMRPIFKKTRLQIDSKGLKTIKLNSLTFFANFFHKYFRKFKQTASSQLKTESDSLATA